MTCRQHDFHWYQNFCTESGWKCCVCQHKPGEPPGFSPELDRAELERKVGAVMHDLHDANFIYISNGTGGDGLTSAIAERCRAEGRYDQGSIALFILESQVPSHAAYWKGISDGIVDGHDPRRRCHCGKLANQYRGDHAYCSFECAKQKELPW